MAISIQKHILAREIEICPVEFSLAALDNSIPNTKPGQTASQDLTLPWPQGHNVTPVPAPAWENPGKAQKKCQQVTVKALGGTDTQVCHPGDREW